MIKSLKFRARLLAHEAREKAVIKVAWLLPRSLVKWCAIRIHAHATTGQWGNTQPYQLDIMTAMKRWGQTHD